MIALQALNVLLIPLFALGITLFVKVKGFEALKQHLVRNCPTLDRKNPCPKGTNYPTQKGGAANGKAQTQSTQDKEASGSATVATKGL